MFYEDCTIEEILAYRELENETFNFGEGDMQMEGLLGSEDVYYRICLQIHSENLYASSLLSYYGKEYKSLNEAVKEKFKHDKEKEELFNYFFDEDKKGKVSNDDDIDSQHIVIIKNDEKLSIREKISKTIKKIKTKH